MSEYELQKKNKKKIHFCKKHNQSFSLEPFSTLTAILVFTSCFEEHPSTFQKTVKLLTIQPLSRGFWTRPNDLN